jgi:hypothetical protein
MKSLFILSILFSATTGFAAQDFTAGLAKINCFNNNYRSLRLVSNGKDTLTFTDSFIGVSDGAEFLSEIMDPKAEIAGFRARGDLTKSCSHVTAVPGVFTCRFQSPIELIDANGKVLANVKEADFTIRTALASKGSSEILDDLDIVTRLNIQLPPDAKHSNYRSIKLTTLNPWIQLTTGQYAGCKIN